LLLKCNFCDPTVTKKMKEEGIKPTKSIDTEADDYVKDDKSKYYHAGCYVQHLIKRKKFSEEDALIKLRIQRDLVQEELKELREKSSFYDWIKQFYDSPLPAYYCTKVSEIVKGVHEKVNEPIPYNILQDIYQKMATYLRKNAAYKNFNNIGQRMNYDLAVVLGNYGDYKNYLAKQKIEKENTKQATTSIEDQKKISKVIRKKEEKSEDFSLSDVLDDLLL
jgi:hypothetical protein